jgi:hypothetical protein
MRKSAYPAINNKKNAGTTIGGTNQEFILRTFGFWEDCR